MAPHNHAEESVVVLDCKDAYVKYGSGPDSLEHTVKLQKGDLCISRSWSGMCLDTRRAAFWMRFASMVR